MPTRPRAATVSALTVLLTACVPSAASPAAAAPGTPATPFRLSLTSGATTMRLSWQQPATGSRARWFQVHEDGAVVARSTPTSALIAVAFGSRHTYTVTAVDADGDESAAAGPVDGYAWTSGLNPE